MIRQDKVCHRHTEAKGKLTSFDWRSSAKSSAFGRLWGLLSVKQKCEERLTYAAAIQISSWSTGGFPSGHKIAISDRRKGDTQISILYETYTPIDT